MARVSEAMDRLAAEHGLAPKLLVQLQVALDEMVSNVIKYAWPEGGTHTLQVRIAVGVGAGADRYLRRRPALRPARGTGAPGHCRRAAAPARRAGRAHGQAVR